MRSRVMDSVLGATSHDSPLAVGLQSSATCANGAGARTGSGCVIPPWGQVLQIRVFLQPWEQGHAGGESPFTNSAGSAGVCRPPGGFKAWKVIAELGYRENFFQQ